MGRCCCRSLFRNMSFPAFIIWIDLRKRERAFPYALEMTSNQVVTFSMVTVALPGMLGEGDRDEVGAHLCFCQPPLTAWNRALFRKSVCVYIYSTFILFIVFAVIFFFNSCKLFVIVYFCKCSLFFKIIVLTWYWNEIISGSLLF